MVLYQIHLIIIIMGIVSLFQEVPEGDWFCPSCRPKEVVHVPRTPRKSFRTVSSSDESDNEEDAPVNDTLAADDLRLVTHRHPFIIDSFTLPEMTSPASSN